MQTIDEVINGYDRGVLTRRQLVQALLAVAVPAAVSAQSATPVFRARAFNHIKIISADVAKSRRFYEALLGVTGGRPTATGLGGQHLVFQGGLGDISVEPPRPGETTGVIEHFCVGVDGDVKNLEADVKRAFPDVKVVREVESGAIFFLDPDGVRVQILAQR